MTITVYRRTASWTVTVGSASLLLACAPSPPASSAPQSEDGPATAAAARTAPLQDRAEPEPPGSETPPERALARARNAMKGLGGELKRKLQGAMKETGPSGALKVCADEAQAITREAASKGVGVGRSSLRLRNPDNAGPEWVQTWLTTQGEREVAGVAPLEQIEGGMARVIQPIAVGGVCVSCHGPRESLAPEVQALLQERYPGDSAVGYAPGQLRGALWAETRVGK